MTRLTRNLLSVFGAALLSGCDGSSESESPPPAASRGPDLFTEITEQSGLGGLSEEIPDGQFEVWEMMGPGVALFDADQDGRLDLLVTRTGLPGQRDQGRPNRFFRQRSDGTFVDASEESGLADSSLGYGIAIGDMDGDGDEDVFFGNLGKDRLYRNEGDGTFTNVTKGSGLMGKEWTTSAAFFDYDRDGDLDLFTVRYVKFDPLRECTRDDMSREYCSPLEYEPVVDRLYRNEGGGKFRDISGPAGIDQPSAGLGVVCADLNRDGWVDIYVANDAMPNHLWINQKDGTFREEALVRGCAVNRHSKPEGSMGVSVADTDADGELDLFMTHLEGENNTFYAADSGGRFQDRTVSLAMSRWDRPYTGFGCAFVDFDHDGDLDLAIANGRIRRGAVLPDAIGGPFWSAYAEPNQLFFRTPEGTYQDRSGQSGSFGNLPEVSRGLAVGDLDRDGDQDLVVAHHPGSVRVYRNDSSDGNQWLRVRAVTRGRPALGAEITAWIDAETSLLRLCHAASGYLSSHEPVADFGLGTATAVEKLEVRWPDGQQERFPGGAAGQEIRLVQGTGEQG